MPRIPQPDDINILDIKQSCRVATTENITLSGEQTIDGISVVSGDRVLVKDQSNSANNGIYICSTGDWQRATDFDTGTVSSGAFTFVEEGTQSENNGFVLSTPDPVTVGTTDLSFMQFTGTGEITAGTGLTKTGNELDVNGGDGIIANADDIQVAVDNNTLELSASDGTGTVRIKDNGVTLSKLSSIANMSVIGNTSGSSATPSAVSILDEDTLSSNSNTALATQQSIKAYVDTSMVPAGSDQQIQYNNGGEFGASSQFVWDDSNNRLGIGTSSPDTKLDIEGEGHQESQIRMSQYNDGADAPDIRFFKARGTIASPSNVSTNDTLGAFNAESYSSGSFSQIGGFAFLAGTSDASKSRFRITTKPTGQSSVQAIVFVEESGNVSFGIGTSNRYMFPTADGDPNQVLKTDGSGTLSFSDDTDTTYTAGNGLSLSGTEFSVSSSQTTITSLLSSSLKIGEDADTNIDFSTGDQIHFYTDGAKQIQIQDGVIAPDTTNDIDLGTSSLKYKDAYFTGTVNSNTFSGNLSGNATTATTLETARTIGGVSFDGSSNIDLPGVNTAGNQDTSGNADSASIATNVTVTANNSNNETVYPVFVDGATGSQGLETDTGLSYNPSSGLLSSTKFNGQMTGNLYPGNGVSMTSSSYNGSTDITITASMGDGFVIEDGDGTEVTITENKEVKIIGGTGIVTNWTDTIHGTDGDPYDLTITCDLEGTELSSTGESGGTKFLREDGDGTCSWQPVPDTDTTYTAGNGLSLSSTEFSSKTDNVTITSRGGGSSDSLAVLRAPGNLYVSGSLSLSAASYNGSADVTITGTNTMGSGFVIEDGDGTEVTITERKEVKIIGGTGIVTNWTDTSNGTDGDPYDLTITCDLEGTELSSTGESGGTKFLREDGDGRCSWQPVPDTDTTYTAGDGLLLSGTEFSVDGAQTSITSVLNSSLTKIGTASAQEYIDFSTTDEITFHVDNTERFSVKSTGANVTGDLTVSGSYDLTGGDGISISGKTLSVDISELSGMDWSGLPYDTSSLSSGNLYLATFEDADSNYHDLIAVYYS